MKTLVQNPETLRSITSNISIKGMGKSAFDKLIKKDILNDNIDIIRFNKLPIKQFQSASGVKNLVDMANGKDIYIGQALSMPDNIGLIGNGIGDIRGINPKFDIPPIVK